MEEGIIIGAVGPSHGVLEASLIELRHPFCKPSLQRCLRRGLGAEEEVKPPPKPSRLLKVHIVKNLMAYDF
jgi:hypothetical protein